MLPVEIHDDVLLRDVGLELDVDAVAIGGDDVTVVALRPGFVRRQKLKMVVHVAYRVLLLHVKVDQPVIKTTTTKSHVLVDRRSQEAQ